MKNATLARVRLGIASLFFALNAGAVEIVHWDRTPLAIDLPIGKERLVVLDRNVSVGLPASIADESLLRVQSVGGVLYLMAYRPFDTQRVQLRDELSGQILLIDLTARDGASDERIRIAFSEEDTGGTANEETDEEPELDAPLPVMLTRYAAQSLYSPLRTIDPVPGIHRSAMRLPSEIPLLPVLPVSASPIAAWSLRGLHVTAVELKNRDPQRAFELDPRHLQGELIAATFMHPTLGPKGSFSDTTTVIVITRGPLVERLPLPRIRPTMEGH